MPYDPDNEDYEMKKILIIAGSDPSAGAGVQQDLKVATVLGAYGVTAITALTVQNTLGVREVQPGGPRPGGGATGGHTYRYHY